MASHWEGRGLGKGRGAEGEEERKGGRDDEERPPTLKCRKIYSFSLFFSHKIVTRGPLKSRKCTRKRLAAGLRPDPLGELKHFPRPPSRNMGAYTSKGRGGKGEEEERGGKEGGEGNGEPPLFCSSLLPCT